MPRKGRRPDFIMLKTRVLDGFASVYRQMPKAKKSQVTSALLTYLGLSYFRNYAKASEHYGTAFPSPAKIAEVTGQSARTVVPNLHTLHDWGLIERPYDEKKRSGRKRITYFIDDPFAFAAVWRKHGRPAAARVLTGDLESERDDERTEIAKGSGLQRVSDVGMKPVSDGSATDCREGMKRDVERSETGFTLSRVEVDLEREKGTRAPADADVCSPSFTPEDQKGNSNGHDLIEEKGQDEPQPQRPVCSCPTPHETWLQHVQAQAELLKREAVH